MAATARDFLALEGLSASQLLGWLNAAEGMMPFATGERHHPTPLPLAGKVVANIFFEDSTRTRVSFEVATKRLGGEVSNLGASGSSASKGETLLDTAKNIEAMGVDAVVVRSAISGAAIMLARHLEVPVINAGDGRHEHPTQGILDLLTLQRHFAKTFGNGEFRGRTVAIVGDIANSRVARSATHGLVTLGATVHLVGPPTLVTSDFTTLAEGEGRVEVGHDLDGVLPSLDAIMLLRIQMERAAGSGVAPDYRGLYGLTEARARRLPERCAVLHPGPVNRGVEIDDAVADDPRFSRILPQVTAGVATRMAVLNACVRES
ncbi:MAG: aspartate carbamoyltransferase catalytic subunit [Phycisphaerae bacterium]|jgi:aspartate carbamoyltransferase catalytic subunit|nr:aspartate carbamoyltransferase catalytic subunit [Phycisphaerae bacterium]